MMPKGMYQILFIYFIYQMLGAKRWRNEKVRKYPIEEKTTVEHTKLYYAFTKKTKI